MKKWILTLSLLLVLILSWCGWTNNLIEYNDTFVALVKECTDSTQALFDTFEKSWSTLDSISEWVQDCINICKNAQEKASKMSDYDKDSSLKDMVVDLLESETEYLKKFWSTERFRNIDELTDEDKTEYDSIVKDLYEEEEKLNEKFVSLQEVQENFAAKHWLNLE